MSNLKKYKVNTKKKQSMIKKGIIVVGIDSENEPIFINAKTTGLLNKDLNSLISKIYADYKLPKTLKKFAQLNAEEKELFKALNEQITDTSFYKIYDETNPAFIEVKEELKVMKLVAEAICCFDMNETVEDEEGKEITHWERFNIPKGDWYKLLKFVVDEENGLGFGFANINIIVEEMNRIKLGEKTLAEKMLYQQDTEDLRKDMLEEIIKTLENINLTDENLEETKEDDSDEQETELHAE